jgi:hypothetical protein
MSREKQLTIQLLEAKIERITGKKVVYESKKKASVRELKEAHTRVARIIRKLEEGKKLTKEEEELAEGFMDTVSNAAKAVKTAVVGDKAAEFKTKAEKTINAWIGKAISKPTAQELDAFYKAAAADKYEGVVSYKDGKLYYKPAKDVKWGSQFAGGGTGNMGTSVSK